MSQRTGSAPAAGPVTINVCVSCRAPEDPGGPGRPGETLLAALRAASPPDGVDLRINPVQCLGVCKRVCTVAVSSPGRYTYIFGDLSPETGAETLSEFARGYAADPLGYLLWKERPVPLRRGIIARVPPPDWNPDDGRHPR